MDPISAYMHLMIKETESRALNISKENLIKLGQTVELFPGVETWFKRINDYAQAKGLKVEHFIISSGLKEIIEGTPIAKEFRKIFAFWRKKILLPLSSRFSLTIHESTKIKGGANMFDRNSDYALNKKDPDAISIKSRPRWC